MTQSDRNYSEKRDFIRMHVDTPITLSKDGQSFSGICLDLSSTGMQVEASTALQLGDRVRIFIPSEHKELRKGWMPKRKWCVSNRSTVAARAWDWPSCR